MFLPKWTLLSFLPVLVSGSAIGSSCVYSFQCARGAFCHEKMCRRAVCGVSADCGRAEYCAKGLVDGSPGRACFPLDGVSGRKLDLCPGGGKAQVTMLGKLELCDDKNPCSGRGICNPEFGVCCTKIRTCPWPKAPLLEGFTHRPLNCLLRGVPAVSCPQPSYCEMQSGFCCADTTPTEKPPRKPLPTESVPPPHPLALPMVGETCDVKVGCGGGAACTCTARTCRCECPKEMGYSVSSDGKSCRRTRRRLKEKCRSDMECSAAFSECTSGGCRCKAGFQRDGDGGCRPVAYKCVNHAEPLKFDNKLTTCVVTKGMLSDPIELIGMDDATNSSTMQAPMREKRCPSHYYCVAVFDMPKKPNTYQGFCCPMPAPDRPVCPVGNPHASSSAPDYGCTECPFDHFCHRDSISTRKEICCPKPCVSPEDIYVDGQCYPIAYHGDSCHVNEQCIGKLTRNQGESVHEELNEMQCRKGICECPKGFIEEDGLCKRVECTVGLRGEPIVNSLGGILRCKRNADCSQGSMCDPHSHVCCKGISRCPHGFAETGQACKDDKCNHPADICIVPKNARSKICCRKEN